MTISSPIKSRFGWANTVMISCEKRVGRISNLQLQKLMYLSYTQHFEEGYEDFYEFLNFEAWKYGPVIPDVYEAYKYCHYGNIPDLLVLTGKVYSYESNGAIAPTVDTAMDRYCKLNVFELVDLTHDQAWEDAFKKDGGRKIDHNAIKGIYGKSN